MDKAAPPTFSLQLAVFLLFLFAGRAPTINLPSRRPRAPGVKTPKSSRSRNRL